jgi:hypothetical protein
MKLHYSTYYSTRQVSVRFIDFISSSHSQWNKVRKLDANLIDVIIYVFVMPKMVGSSSRVYFFPVQPTNTNVLV